MTPRTPLAIDLCAGLGGWTDGLLAAGFDVVGFDIERHVYGEHRYPAQLVLQDIRTLDGRQFRGKASLIVASPPCQEFSYMSMPWKRAKQIAAAFRGEGDFPEKYTGSRTVEELNALFDACVRIGKEAGVPTVIENVRGAQPWVGKARWNFGSYYLWGDVPALMPATMRAEKFKPDGTQHGAGSWFAVADSKERGARSEGQKVPGFRFDGSGRSFQSQSVDRHTKSTGGSWFNIGSPGQKVVAQNPDGRLLHKRDGHGHTRHLTNQAEHDGGKQGGEWFSDPLSGPRQGGKGSPARKMASAMIAKIPFALALHIAETYYPSRHARSA